MHAAFNRARVDEVKWLGEIPLELEVVDFEDTVWWNPRRIKRAWLHGNASHDLVLGHGAEKSYHTG